MATNRSQMIRDLFVENPNLSAKEIVAALAAKKVCANEALVYVVKGKMKRRISLQPKCSKADPIILIREIKSLAKKIGGMARLKEFVDVLLEGDANGNSPTTV